MKVIEINTVYKFGSTGKIVYDLRNTLLEKGHSVVAVSGREYNGNDENVYVIGNKLQRYADALACRIFDNAGLGIKDPTKRLIRIIDEYSPDVVHLHNIHGYYINIRLLFDYLKSKNYPVVWTLHDCWAFTGHCAYFDFCGCDKWISSCSHCIQKQTYPTSKVFDMSERNYALKKKLETELKQLHIVTPSDWLHDLVSRSFLSNNRVLTINNGIDLEVFKPTKSNTREKYGLKNKKIVLAVASLWGERKGWSDYIKLASKLDDDTVIVMIGLNETQIKKLPSNIIGIKRTSSLNELVEWYSCSDVFLNLTREDNFPTVNIESLACGLPIISYKTGGSTEAFDSKSGIIVEKGNIDHVSEILKRRAYEQISRAYCEEHAKRYDKKLCYNKYLDLFMKIVSEDNV